VEDVASIDGWHRNAELVQEFYNQRRKAMLEARPNAGHYEMVRLEQYYDVHIITQNVDNLHERAGSKNIIHLHGELTKACSERNHNYVVNIEGWELKHGSLAPDGGRLRPYKVWFGEAVPMIEQAIDLCEQADVFIVVGTSLNVYPAAGLIHYVPPKANCYLVDPNVVAVQRKLTTIAEKAGTGVKKVVDELIEEATKN
jgi:NAD-dependent deacetylase